MKLVGFARVTIHDVDLESQLKQLESFGCDKIFEPTHEENEQVGELKDVESLIQVLEAGDTLVVTKLNRLGKSTRQLTELTSIFKEKGVNLVSLEEEIDTRKSDGKIYFQLMEHLANMECDLIKERTMLGLKKARQNGKVGGRPKIDGRTVKKIRTLYFDKKATIQEISGKVGVSVGTCYKYINMSSDDASKFVKK
ncbi:MAG: recombinase family protein [Lactobacillales bacterium]|jgi:DNA invertase Pin-like site-specific DNA recombinase|nr:recombinase family protein [Lactobacillales bacterium]